MLPDATNAACYMKLCPIPIGEVVDTYHNNDPVPSENTAAPAAKSPYWQTIGLMVSIPIGDAADALGK